MKILTPHSRLAHMLILTMLVLFTALPGISSIPAIDRDEARYAQATVQMIESGDPIDIRFQDAPRWKKPAGAYWAQAVSVTLFGGPEARAIWKHRLPSVLAALIAVLATYWAGRRLVGREAAFIGAALFAVSLGLVYEAHAAKTDALLVASTTICFGALAHIRHNPLGTQKTASLLFWMALGAGVMLKGPIAPMIVALAIAALMIWERRAAWAKPLLFWPGPILFFLIVLPWTILIWQKTNGAFFTTAFTEDLAPKMTGGQEKHGGLPGYHLVSAFVMFFPAIVLLPAGIAYAVRALRVDSDKFTPLKRAIRLMICWVVPFWIVLEITPTKLPHYGLPLYPALALLCGTAGALLLKIKEFPVTRMIGGALYIIFGVTLSAGVIFAHSFYRSGHDVDYGAMSMGIILCLIFLVAGVLFFKRNRHFVKAIIASGAALMMVVFGYLMPGLDTFYVSQNLAAMMNDRGIKTPLAKGMNLRSPHFTEASLVFALGTQIKLGGEFTVDNLSEVKMGEYLLLDVTRNPQMNIADSGICFDTIGSVEGYNYAKGDALIMTLLRRKDCPVQSAQ